MNKIMSSMPAILFIFILFVPHQSLAHGSYEKHEKAAEHKEEGSGMR